MKKKTEINTGIVVTNLTETGHYQEDLRKLKFGIICPDCGSRMIPSSGCSYCPICGWSRCS